MEGCVKEGAEALSEEGDETVLDLGIIGAGSRVEHYEMAGYLTAISLAEQIGEKEVVILLKEILVRRTGSGRQAEEDCRESIERCAAESSGIVFFIVHRGNAAP